MTTDPQPWFYLTGYARSRGRNVEMLEHYDAGMSITELAARYNLTYARAHQIVTEARGKIRDKPRSGK